MKHFCSLTGLGGRTLAAGGDGVGVLRRAPTFKLVLQELPKDSAFLADSRHHEGVGHGAQPGPAPCGGVRSVVFVNPELFC